INEFEGKPFIVMEYVDGKTLNDIVGAENLLPLQDAIAIALQVSEGLKAAHNKGIVHRDIKPSNILISTEKQAKILDFGLAKTSMSTKLTQMGTTIGTVAYMSPEQVQGKEVDHRTDLWSLGVVLYEMISGRLPFAADYDQAIFYAIQNEEPEALTSIRSGVPMSLEWIVAKLMAKDAGERYQSANDLIIDLKAIDLSNTGMSRITKTTVQKPAEKSPKKEKRIDPYKPIAVVATLFLVYFIIHYFYQVNKSSDESLHFNISAIENNKVQLYKSDMQVIAISPDGSRIAYIVVEGGKTNIYVKSLKDFKITKLEGLGSVSGEPFFSPDGNYIGFNADGQLKRVSLLNRTVDVLINKPVYRGASWMDNNRIVYSQTYHSGLTMLNLSSGKETKLTDLDSLRGERTHRWPQVLPDGKHIIFTIGSVNSPNSYEDAELAILSLDDNSKHILSVKGEMARYLEPGYIIIGKDGKLLAAPFDLENYKFLSAPEPVLSNVEGDVGSGISFFGLSDNGNIVYVKGNRNQAMNIVLVSNKEESEILPVPANPFLLPRISPDGTKILVNVGTQSTARDIWIYDLQTELFRRLTFGMKALYPLWSNNKDGFYFLSTDKGNGEIIYQSLKDGSNKVVNSFNAGTATSILSVSPDDKYMFVNVLGDAAAWDLELLNLQNKESEKLNISGLGGNFSPDGRYLAYSSLETEIQEIYVTDFPKFELKWQISNDGGFSPRWSPDGKKLYYISMNGIMMELPVKLEPVFSPGKQNEIMDVSSYYFPSDNADNYDITPDGEHFIMIKNSDTQEQLKSFNMIYNWTAELDKIFQK
ncbi:MAG: serine/threonine-protein kinase, partial [Calditrichaeota bacterium]|nr:serine/threonine-protein kinase [Calditrichota bacterium]